MNLEKLFSMQKSLDERIVREKDLEGQDLLPEKILALQVELGELANEWRGFKFWATDQEPRVYKEEYDIKTDRFRSFNPLLEEYVDCIHFFIGVAIDLNIEPEKFTVESDYTQPTTTLTFNRVFSTLSTLDVLMDPCTPASFSNKDLQDTLHEAFSCFIGLAEKHLGFTWNQIEQAYFDKNAVNHVRQDTGY